jgi:hypothetical protein
MTEQDRIIEQMIKNTEALHRIADILSFVGAFVVIGIGAIVLLI